MSRLDIAADVCSHQTASSFWLSRTSGLHFSSHSANTSNEKSVPFPQRYSE